MKVRRLRDSTSFGRHKAAADTSYNIRVFGTSKPDPWAFLITERMNRPGFVRRLLTENTPERQQLQAQWFNLEREGRRLASRPSTAANYARMQRCLADAFVVRRTLNDTKPEFDAMADRAIKALRELDRPTPVQLSIL